MGQPATSSSQRGLLLVEAGLSAVVIAVGLVFISRGLTNQLKALRTVDEYETLLSLAHGKLSELEAQRLRPGGIPPPPERPEGLFEVSDEAASESTYQWRVTVVRREDLDVDQDGRPLFSDITLAVRRQGDLPALPAGGGQASERRSSAVTLSAIWPTDWVPAEWF